MICFPRKLLKNCLLYKAYDADIIKSYFSHCERYVVAIVTLLDLELDKWLNFGMNLCVFWKYCSHTIHKYVSRNLKKYCEINILTKAIRNSKHKMNRLSLLLINFYFCSNSLIWSVNKTQRSAMDPTDWWFHRSALTFCLEGEK